MTTKRLPAWFKVKFPGGNNYRLLSSLLREQELHTVCEEAKCPNIGECWERKSATFMILGDICTRACRYCAVTSGRPVGLDLTEPDRLAVTVAKLALRYCVITAVNRDDLADGGAYIFAQCVRRIRFRVPGCKVELLIPDFEGNQAALEMVMESQPDVLNHNIETVREVFRSVRAKGNYDRSLKILEQTKKLAPSVPTKSGIMVGLGESRDQLINTMEDLRAVGCDLLTLGQYLQPSQNHVPISRFYSPSEFQDLSDIGYKLGFAHVAAGPLVRSSYHADTQHDAAISRIAASGAAN